jgi:hypothetical protein
MNIRARKRLNRHRRKNSHHGLQKFSLQRGTISVFMRIKEPISAE